MLAALYMLTPACAIPRPPAAGFTPPGTTVVERRAIASQIPTWIKENCTQCNICSFVCPHAAIRPALAKADEAASAPETFQMVKARGAGLGEYQYRMQVSPVDCTGCTLCVSACPDKALAMKPLPSVLEVEDKNWGECVRGCGDLLCCDGF